MMIAQYYTEDWRVT